MFKTINGVFGILAPLKPISGWFVRLPWAAVFLYHGSMKFMGGLEGFSGMLEGTFGSLAMPVAFLVALAEVLAGIGAIVGGFSKNDFGDAVTRLAGLAAFPVMIGALVMVRLGGPWSAMELDVLLLGVAIYLMIKGKDV
jgi:putative oxidoreductase